MCGIVGCTGSDPVLPIVLEGLARLEYRGYDSAGVALQAGGSVWIRKRAGKLSELTGAVGDAPRSTAGIGHTRWATHGRPNEANAHPHADCSGRLALIHNGIVENFLSLRARLEGTHEIRSETDTELLAHLIEERIASGDDLPAAMRAIMREVEGSFALVAVHASDPELVVGARRVSPLIAAVSDGAAYLASDIPALLPYTRDFRIIDDDQVVELRPGSLRITDLSGREVEAPTRHVEWDLEEAEKGGFPDFMLKEIHEQPVAVAETLRGRINTIDGRIILDELRLAEDDLRDIDKVFIVACGTSYHAGMVAKYAIEHWTRLPCEIDIASEFRYRDPVVDTRTLVVGVSQSGETADTIAACRYAKRLGARVIAVSNVVDSSMARDADAVLYTHAGPEVGVAATKTHLAQIVALVQLGLYLAQVRGTLYPSEIKRLLDELHEVPEHIAALLARDDDTIQRVARQYVQVRDFFFVGRGVGYPVALEGALKLKEISYARAEGYPGGELKHGPIALIEPGVVVVGVATRSHVHAKTLSNIEEVRARGATVILVATEGDADAEAVADHVFWVPETSELFSPAVDVVPLQLFAYHMAKYREHDVDKPRNLAKTVTVE